MATLSHAQLPDNTAIIIGSGQIVEHLHKQSKPPFSSPMQLAAAASQTALENAGVTARDVDTIAVIQLFSDAAKAWASPFGGSNNPPESIATRIGATPCHRIYSNSGGTEPLQIMIELLQAIARGEKKLALLSGAEAIANQRFAVRNNYELDWHEEFDAPLDRREHSKRFVSNMEISSRLRLPAHYYALIENVQAQQLGHDQQQHQYYMAQMMAPFSRIAAANPYSQFPVAYTPEQLVQQGPGNYPISLPYSKLLVAQDSVNQASALVLTSAGHARQLGVDPQQWIFLEAYADGVDQCLSERADPARSEAMSRVLTSALDRAGATPADMDLIDIYSCFPSAVHAACEVLGLPTDGSRPLTVTGGLPYFGGPGNSYSLHALAEMTQQLRNQHEHERALVTANGGFLSKHAAAVLTSNPTRATNINWEANEGFTLDCSDVPTRPTTEQASQGMVVSYTVVARRDDDDVGIVLAETFERERFLASSAESAMVAVLQNTNPIGRPIDVRGENNRQIFSFRSG